MQSYQLLPDTQAIENFFRVCIARYKHGMGWENSLETVMQTRDELERLHNFREFPQPRECKYQAMQNTGKSFLLLS